MKQKERFIDKKIQVKSQLAKDKTIETWKN